MATEHALPTQPPPIPTTKPSWVDKHQFYTDLAREVEPASLLVTKDHWIWAVMGYALAIVTFGKRSKKQFVEEIATTVGPVMAYPRQWEALSRKLIKHEARHARQSRWFGLGLSPWLGLPFMAIFYLLLPVPVLGALARFLLERDADRESWKFQFRRGKSYAHVRNRAVAFSLLVCGSPYAWCLPKKLGTKLFVKAFQKTAAEMGVRKED